MKNTRKNRFIWRFSVLRELIFRTFASNGPSSRSFIVLISLLFIPSAAIWFFYRSLFQADASIGGMVALSVMTAWLWAYLIGFGTEDHLVEITE